jgi:hypothetical protein
MKKLAVSVWIAAALFGLLGVVVFHSAPLNTERLTDGYGVGYMTAAAAETAK